MTAEKECAGHVIEGAARRGLNAQFLRKLVIFFVAHEIDRVIFAEIEVIGEVELVIHIRRLRDQLVVANVEFRLEAGDIRCRLVEGVTICGEAGKLRGLVVEHAFAIGCGQIGTDQLVARTDLLIVSILVGACDPEGAAQTGAQRCAQAQILMFRAFVSGDRVADPAVQVVVVCGHAQRYILAERCIASGIERVTAVLEFITGAAF